MNKSILKIIKDETASNDIYVLAFIILLAGIYGTFFAMYSADTSPTAYDMEGVTVTGDWGTWFSTTLFSTIASAVSVSIANPEIGFLNVLVFGSLAILFVFITIRFIRGS